MITRPTPSDMAREYRPIDDNAPAVERFLDSAQRSAYAAGIAAERSRVAAWLREQSAFKAAETMRVCGPDYTSEDHRFAQGRASAFKAIALLATDLESPR